MRVFLLLLDLYRVIRLKSLIHLLLLFIQKGLCHNAIDVFEPLQHSQARLFFLMSQKGFVLVVLQNVDRILLKDVRRGVCQAEVFLMEGDANSIKLRI